MRASLFRLSERPLHADPETGRQRSATDREMRGWGYRLVGTLDGGELWHAAPGVALPDGAEIIKDGRAASWRWADLRAENGKLADALLHATYRTEDAEGNPVLGRGIIREEKARGNIPSAVESDLPPHVWMGDE